MRHKVGEWIIPMSSLLGSDDHWFTVAVASIIVVVAYGAFSVPWYWALVVGAIVSGVLELAIEEIPPDTDEYDSSQYQLWEKAFGDTQNNSENTIKGTTTDSDESIEHLRNRYARGGLTDEQFERKVEKLLETESLDDSEEREKARDLVTEQNG